MIFPHPESQFSDRQKNAHTHLVKKYWDFRKWLPTSPWFITLFSLLPPSTLRKEYLAMLSDLPTKLLIPHTGCCYKWAYTQGIDTSQPYWSRLPGGREVAGAINSSSHFLHHPTPFHSLQPLGPNEYRSRTKSLPQFPSSSHVASEVREQILLEMSKARETAHWPEILFGRWCLSVLLPHCDE